MREVVTHDPFGLEYTAIVLESNCRRNSRVLRIRYGNPTH